MLGGTLPATPLCLYIAVRCGAAACRTRHHGSSPKPMPQRSAAFFLLRLAAAGCIVDRSVLHLSQPL